MARAKGSRYEWKCTTPMMVMPDGSVRSFDTFTKEELQAWWKRKNIEIFEKLGYKYVGDVVNEKEEK